MGTIFLKWIKQFKKFIWENKCLRVIKGKHEVTFWEKDLP